MPFAVKTIRLSSWPTVAEDKQLGDGDRINSENTSSSRAPSADDDSEDGDISGRHSRFRDASFTAGLLCMLLKGERSVNSCQGESQSVAVSKLKTKDGHTVGLVVRAFFRGFAVPGDTGGFQINVYLSSVGFLFRVESSRVLALPRNDSPEHYGDGQSGTASLLYGCIIYM